MARSYITTESYYPCPCCGYRTFAVAGASMSCPICAWQDSVEQLQDPYRVCAPNWVSLYEAQLSFLRCGASQLSKAAMTNTPLPGDARDKNWRLIRSCDSFGTYERRSKLKFEDYKELYYWADEFWNSKLSFKRQLHMSMV